MPATIADKSVRWVRLAARATDYLRPARTAFEGVRRAFYDELWRSAARAIGAELEPLRGEVLPHSKGDA